MKLLRLYVLCLLLYPGFVYGTVDVSVLIGGGGFIQGEDFLSFNEIGDSSRQLSVQVTNRIVKHVSLGADISFVDSYTKYNINNSDLISDKSYLDYLNLFILSSYDFLDNVFFIQLGLGMIVELFHKERILLGGMFGLGINIPIADNLYIPIMARSDMFMSDGVFRYPISFGIGITYRIE